MLKLEADVCVVGAGYAGLAAAKYVREAGRTAIVLEARNRVGGRVWSQTGPDGVVLDMGGTFLGGGHDSVRRLAEEYKLLLYPLFEDGEKLFVVDGQPRRYRRSISEAVPEASGFRPYMDQLDAMAGTLPVDEPWSGERALEWDHQTLAGWIAAEVRQPVAAALLRHWLGMLFCVDLDEASLLNGLWLIRTAGSLRVLLGTKGGYNQDHVEGGAQSIANRIAAELDDGLRLSQPVRTIVQGSDGVTVRSDDVEVEAGHAIVALLPVHASQLMWEPKLPTDRVALYQRSPNGLVLKTVLVYGTPFWRADGLSGESLDPHALVDLTMDTSPEDGRHGVLTAWASGPPARRLGQMAPAERRRTVLDTLASRFGPKAADPIHYVDQDWASDEWSRGCHLVHYAGGVLTQYGPVIREPFGRVHFAGAETATVSHGAIDGACRSGERAAAEVVAD